MTRINVIVPDIDQHLRRARDEAPRIMTKIRELINENALHRLDAAPKAYTVQTADNKKGGRGHMMFFCDKLAYMYRYYHALLAECESRGFIGGQFENKSLFPDAMPRYWVASNGKTYDLWNDYQPTPEAIAMNRKRMIERIPDKPYYKGELITRQDAIHLIETAKVFYRD